MWSHVENKWEGRNSNNIPGRSFEGCVWRQRRKWEKNTNSGERWLWVGRYSSVGIATFYQLDGLGFESRWGEIFRTCPERPRGPPSLLCSEYRVFTGGKAAGVWRWPPTPSSAEVKGKVELYLCSSSGPSWPVYMVNNTFIFTLSWLSAVRSGGRGNSAEFYRSDIPGLLIRIRHWTWKWTLISWIREFNFLSMLWGYRCSVGRPQYY
jgi:hypothetical protein